MDVCLLLLEDGSGYLLLEGGSLRLEDGTGDLLLESSSLWGSAPWGSAPFGSGGTLRLEDAGRLELEACPQPVSGEPLGGWAEPATVRENEVDLVIAVLHSLRGRRRLTVG